MKETVVLCSTDGSKGKVKKKHLYGWLIFTNGTQRKHEELLWMGTMKFSS